MEISIAHAIVLIALSCMTHLVYGFSSKNSFYRDFHYKTNYIIPYDDVGMPDAQGAIIPPKADPIDISRVSACYITSPREIRIPHSKNTPLVVETFETSSEEADHEETFYSKKKEASFQISFKIPLFEIEATSTRFYAAYTQNSYWQSHTKKHAFMRENNYNPEFFIEQDFTIQPGLGPQIKKVKLGLIHQSNGRGMKPGPKLQKSYERSWNRLYVAINLQWGPHCIIVLEPWRILKTRDHGKYNKDIAEHLGYGQLTFVLEKNFLYFECQKRLKSFQAIAIFPITPSLNCVARYFNGYGSTVGMYNKPAHSIGIGIGLRV